MAAADTTIELAAVVDALDALDGQRATLVAQRDDLIVDLRQSGASLADIAVVAHLSRPGVLKALRRHDE